MGDWVLHFDGLYEPRYSDRGIATYGFQVTHEDAVVAEDKGLVTGPGGPLATANVAEFGALIQGLAWLRDHRTEIGECPIVVRGDNRLSIETTAGRWKLSSETLLPLRDAARALAGELGITRFEKVSREENAEADRLSREAYRELTDAHPEWGLGAWSKTGRRTRARRPGPPE